jgi:hypothetical protein
VGDRVLYGTKVGNGVFFTILVGDGLDFSFEGIEVGK